MGVEFFPCDSCGESICDCGDYERCGCGRKWCNEKCATKDGYDSDDENADEGGSCSFCRMEQAEDYQLLNYLLEKYNLTREQILGEWKVSNKKDKT